MKQGRRRFVKQAAAISAAAFTAPSAWSSQSVTTSPLCFFTKHLQWLDFADTARVLQAAGYDGADLTVRRGGHIEPSEAKTKLQKAISAFANEGLQVPMVVSGVKEADDSNLDSFLEVLADNGVKYYRMGYLGYDRGSSIDQNIRRFSEIFKRLADKNDKYGLCGCYQNHAGTRLGGSLWDLKLSLTGINPDLLSCQFDIRHAVFEGMRSWENDLLALQPHIRTTAIKDFRWTFPSNKKWDSQHVPLGDGVVDFSTYFQYYAGFQQACPITIHAEYPLFSKAEELQPKSKKMDLSIDRLGEDLTFVKKQLKSHE